MAKKIQIFDELMEGFRDAIARKKGLAVALRLTEIRPPETCPPAPSASVIPPTSARKNNSHATRPH